VNRAARGRAFLFAKRGEVVGERGGEGILKDEGARRS